MRSFGVVSSTTALSLFATAFWMPALKLPSAEAQEIVRQEIRVTARRREEGVQDVPLSVTAFTGADIERGAFQDFEDVSLFTPGVQFNAELSGNRPGRLFSNIRFRGLQGQQFTTFQTASLFVDGVFALQSAQSLALVDLERVEVIKGPQSALFGRNSFAGAVNYVTSTPDLGEFSGKIVAEAATFDQYEVSARVDIPVIRDTMSVRIGGRFFNKGDMYTASDGGALGEQSSRSAFGVLYWEPDESVRVKIRGYYQQDDDGPEAIAFLQGRFNDTCTGTSRPGLDVDGNPVTLMPQGFICGEVPDIDAGGPQVDSNTGLFPVIFGQLAPGSESYIVDNLLNYNDLGIGDVPTMDGLGIRRNISRVSGVVEADLPWDVTATLTASYNKNTAAALRDWDQTPVESWYVVNPQWGDDWGVDLRFQSGGDERFRWLGGFNYYSQDFLTSGQGGVFVHVCGFAGLGGAPCPDTGASPARFIVANDGGDFVDVWGVYGSASYDIFERLTLDAEFRYQEDKRGDGVTDTEITFDSWSPRFSLTYKATDNINIYATASRGNLPGRINTNALTCGDQTYTVPFVSPVTGMESTSSGCQQIVEQAGPNALDLSTPAQRLDSLEAGIKSTWLDGRLTFNIAGYWMEWKDHVTAEFVTIVRDTDGDGIPNTVDIDPTGDGTNPGPSNPNFVTVVAPGSSRYYGIEIEAVAELMEGLVSNFSFSWNENKLTQFLSTLGSVRETYGTANVAGNRSTRFPKWQASASATYTRAVPVASMQDWDWYVRGDVTYQGSSVTGVANLAETGDWILANVRLGMERENLRLEFFVKNLFQEKTWRGGQDFTDFSTVPWPGSFNDLGAILVPQDKRTFGVRSSVSF